MSTVKPDLLELLTSLVVVAVLAGWSAFWAMVARIHYLHGDLASMAFTTGVFVIPAVAGAFWYLSQSLDVDVPSPNLDADIGSS